MKGVHMSSLILPKNCESLPHFMKGKAFLLSPKLPDRLGGSPNLLFSGQWGIFPRG